MSATISAADVKKLRDTTGAGMMDCKKALAEAGGDFDAAIDILRKQGQKMSAKRADREAKEGVVIALVSDDKKRGVVVRLGCETDFVAKNEDFVKLTEKIAEIALKEFPATVEELLSKPFNSDLTVDEKLTEQVGVIGEKIELSSYHRIEAPQVVSYIHMGHKAGVILGLSSADAAYHDPGRDVAMQVAAMHPIAVDEDGVDASTIQKEIEIGMDIARNEGKPEEMLERIAKGKLNKFFKESTLLNQQFVKDNKMTVRDYLQSLDKSLTVTDFKHVRLG
jgi:elongation factor Ts